MSLKTQLVLILAKSLSFSLRKAKFTGGTAFPGLIGLQLDANFNKNLAKKIPVHVIISGTNGKTSTARMLTSMLAQANVNFIHNRAGSNLLRGIASTLAEKMSIFEKPKYELGVWEVDEATVLPAISDIKPQFVVLLNLFRDQLDRYGEVDRIKKLWTKAIKKLPKESTLILAADDPAIANLGKGFGGNFLHFGVEDREKGEKTVPKFADTKHCPVCNTPLTYKIVYSSHLGEYYCQKCGLTRPKLDFSATNIKLTPERSEFSLRINNHLTKTVNLKIGGLYNIYNSLAAITTAAKMGISLDTSLQALAKFKSAFGRIEQIQTKNGFLKIFLIKNPTGANEVLKTVFSGPKKKNLLLALNDKIADGTDVSWIWDVDFEKIGNKTAKLIVTGTRANDLALRLKYAGIKNRTLITNDFAKAVKTAIGTKGDFHILPTYTAMLEIRRQLNKLGLGTKFWED